MIFFRRFCLAVSLLKSVFGSAYSVYILFRRFRALIIFEIVFLMDLRTVCFGFSCGFCGR